MFRTLENDPLFARQPGEDVPIEKKRELNFLRYLLGKLQLKLCSTRRVLCSVSRYFLKTIKLHMKIHRMKQLLRYNFVTKEDAMANPWKAIYLDDCLGMYDWALVAKLFLSLGVIVFE